MNKAISLSVHIAPPAYVILQPDTNSLLLFVSVEAVILPAPLMLSGQDGESIKKDVCLVKLTVIEPEMSITASPRFFVYSIEK